MTLLCGRPVKWSQTPNVPWDVTIDFVTLLQPILMVDQSKAEWRLRTTIWCPAVYFVKTAASWRKENSVSLSSAALIGSYYWWVICSTPFVLHQPPLSITKIAPYTAMIFMFTLTLTFCALLATSRRATASSHSSNRRALRSRRALSTFGRALQILLDQIVKRQIESVLDVHSVNCDLSEGESMSLSLQKEAKQEMQVRLLLFFLLEVSRSLLDKRENKQLGATEQMELNFKVRATFTECTRTFNVKV